MSMCENTFSTFHICITFPQKLETVKMNMVKYFKRIYQWWKLHIKKKKYTVIPNRLNLACFIKFRPILALVHLSVFLYALLNLILRVFNWIFTPWFADTFLAIFFAVSFLKLEDLPSLTL